ncbi:MAG: hypothetical protein ABWY25_10985 [Paenisporosarcina sp.]
MSNAIIVHIGRTNIVPVSLGMDVSQDDISSEIRTQKDTESDLIATWDVANATDGIDGELVLTLDDAVSATITEEMGYMDMKRVTGGEPIPVFGKPIPVIFRKVVTE